MIANIYRYISANIIKNLFASGSLDNWILASGYWNDDGLWDDDKFWID